MLEQIEREFKRDAYRTVRDLPTLEDYLRRAKLAGAVGIDTEADSFDPMRAQLVGISLSIAANDAIYIPLQHKGADSRAGELFASEVPSEKGAPDAGAQIPLTTALAALQPLLVDPSVTKVGINIKWDIALFAKHGITLAPYDDPMLASYTLYGGLDDHDKISLIEKHIGHTLTPYGDVAGKGKAQQSFDLVPIERAAAYSCETPTRRCGVFNYLRPFALRKKKSAQLNQYDMFQNYFKIASRYLIKQKLYSGINIAGLALGLTCFMVILLYVQHEFSYDRFYPNVQRIYRVYQKQAGNEFMGTDYFAVTPAQLARVMMEECPEVAHATSVQRTSGLLSHNDTNFWQEVIAADAEFFNVFKINFNAGNPQTALADGRSIVLTQTLAQTVFGDQDPIGKAFRYQDVAEDFIVTGIIPDPPANASFKYSFVIHLLYSTGYTEEIKRTGWSNISYYTFFEVEEAASISDLENRFPALLKKYQLPEDYANYAAGPGPTGTSSFASAARCA